MFGSVNVLSGLDDKLHASQFTPIDVVAVLGINYGLTMHACDSDSFRIMTPFVGDKIAEATGDKFGWLGDARFLLGLVSAGVAHFGTKQRMDGTQLVSDGMARGLHDVTAGCWTSLVATETCRAEADQEIAQEGGTNMALGLDDGLLDDDLGLDDDLMGLDEYADAGSMNFAYGW